MLLVVSYWLLVFRFKKMVYTQLDVWIKSRRLTNEIYSITKDFPKDELFGLVSQMRRSAVSVPSNIAEGCGRKSPKETEHFLHISRGSLFELETQLYVAYDQNYCRAESFEETLENVQHCKKLLNGFINYFNKLH